MIFCCAHDKLALLCTPHFVDQSTFFPGMQRYVSMLAKELVIENAITPRDFSREKMLRIHIFILSFISRTNISNTSSSSALLRSTHLMATLVRLSFRSARYTVPYDLPKNTPISAAAETHTKEGKSALDAETHAHVLSTATILKHTRAHTLLLASRSGCRRQSDQGRIGAGTLHDRVLHCC